MNKNIWQIFKIIMEDNILYTPSKVGVFERWIFSHTPEEAMSVGLAKACVPRKNDSVQEKLSYLMKIKQNEKSTFIYDAIKFYPLLQLTIDLWNTTTPNLWVILTLSLSPQPTFMEMNFPVTGNIPFLVFHRKDLCEARVNFKVSSYLADGCPPSIDHRSMEDHYTN